MDHTKAPWKAQRIGGAYNSNREQGMAFRVLSASDNRSQREIGLLYYKPMWEEAEANARLIESAPALLAVLKDIISYWRYNDQKYYESDLATDAINAVRSAEPDFTDYNPEISETKQEDE